MEYIIRFSQSHETFRLPEIEALALIEGVDLKVVSYSLEVSISSIVTVVLYLFMNLFVFVFFKSLLTPPQTSSFCPTQAPPP